MQRKGNRIFLTGATGFVGAAVARELQQAGYQICGLARTEEAAEVLAGRGMETHRGSLDDLDSLRRGAAKADAVIHTAFVHDFSRFKENCELDRRALEALGRELAGTGRPLLITSAIGILPQGHLATEETLPQAGLTGVPRAATEAAAAAVAELGARVAVIRLPASVHGAGDRGFVPMLIRIAREKGVSVCIGEGLNRWPAVHCLDAARLYRLVLEQRDWAVTGEQGRVARFHAVAEAGVPFRSIAAAIGRGLDLPCSSVPPEQAAEHFGWLAHFAAMDMPASSQGTREALGWAPHHPGLLTDLAVEGVPGYFGSER
ncbi:SDR family oxidoreductase [Megalodesulfovibrio paquesii]